MLASRNTFLQNWISVIDAGNNLNNVSNRINQIHAQSSIKTYLSMNRRIIYNLLYEKFKLTNPTSFKIPLSKLRPSDVVNWQSEVNMKKKGWTLYELSLIEAEIDSISFAFIN